MPRFSRTASCALVRCVPLTPPIATCSAATRPARRGNHASPCTGFATRNCPAGRRIEDVEAVVYHSDMERTGWFESPTRCSTACTTTSCGACVAISSTCRPTARNATNASAGPVTSRIRAHRRVLYDCTGLLASWLRDLAVEQRRFGTVPYYVPWIPQRAFPFEPAAVWGDAAVLVPLRCTSGPAMPPSSLRSTAAWPVGSTRSSVWPRRSGLWDTGFQFGDWLDPSAPPDRPGVTATDPYLVANAYLVHSLDIMTRVAELLDRHHDARSVERRRGIDAQVVRGRVPYHRRDDSSTTRRLRTPLRSHSTCSRLTGSATTAGGDWPNWSRPTGFASRPVSSGRR